MYLCSAANAVAAGFLKGLIEYPSDFEIMSIDWIFMKKPDLNCMAIKVFLWQF